MLRIRLRDWPWALKLVALLVLTAVVPVCVLTVYSDWLLRVAALAGARERNLLRARTTSKLVDAYLSNVAADVTIVALAPETVSALNNPGDPARLQELSSVLAGIARTQGLPVVSVMDSAGRVIASTDSRSVGADRLAAPHFLSAISGQTRVHDPAFVAADGQLYMRASVPVRDRADRIIGAVSARIPMTELDSLVASDTDFAIHGEYGILWDERGIALSSPAHPELRFRPLGTLPKSTLDQLVAEDRFGPATKTLLSTPAIADALVQWSRSRMSDDRSDPLTRTDFGGGTLHVAAAAMRDRRWTYAVIVPESSVVATVREQSRRNLVAALATALLGFLLAIVSAQWLSRPINQVRDAARALAAGEMTRRVRLERSDEIGQMAGAFDSMADALSEKDAQLRQHADSLERRVADRTAELNGLVAAIPDLLFRMSRDGRLIDYRAPREQDLIVPPEQFLGRQISDVLPPNISEPALAALAKVLAGESAAPFEYHLQVAGAARYFEARASASGPDSAVFLVRDITDRRHHEERTRFLARAGATLTGSLDYGNTVETLAQLPVPFLADISIVDLLEHGELHCAAVAARTPELQAIVRAQRSAYPVQVSSAHPVAEALRHGPALFQSVRTPDLGSASLLALPLVARGQTLGVLGIASTNHERRYTADDFVLAQELAHRGAIALDNARLYRDLQESSRMKDEFLGIVSHELRTPLNAVLGWAQVLRRAPSDGEQNRRAIDTIERNGRMLAQLVDDLLDTSRVISGKLRLEAATVDVGAVVTAAVESFRPTARAAGLQLSAAVADDLGEIRGDAGRLQQVIGNLLSNAVKFTRAGGRVDVTAARSGPYVEIRISDTGIGIAPEFIPHVFERFRQADSTTTRAHGGLGLGLAIARYLIEVHGGTIRAESDGPNLGSTFTVMLPAKPAVIEPPAESAALTAIDARTSLTGLRILAVDDSDDALTLVQTTLESAGAEVLAVSSVPDALEQLSIRRPDVVVADIGMPGADGYSLVREIRMLEERDGQKRLPAIALTAYARASDRQRAVAAGFDLHLSKPVDPGALVQAIRGVTADPSLRPRPADPQVTG